jgi:hypothetical protein
LTRCQAGAKAEAQIRFLSRVASDSPRRGRVPACVNQVLTRCKSGVKIQSSPPRHKLRKRAAEPRGPSMEQAQRNRFDSEYFILEYSTLRSSPLSPSWLIPGCSQFGRPLQSDPTPLSAPRTRPPAPVPARPAAFRPPLRPTNGARPCRLDEQNAGGYHPSFHRVWHPKRSSCSGISALWT